MDNCYFVRAAALDGFSDLAWSKGLDPRQLLMEVGLRPAALSDPDQYVSYPLVAKLLQYTAHRCGEYGFGVELARKQGLSTIGALAEYISMEKNLGEALRTMIKHLDYHAYGANLSVSNYRGRVELEVSLAFENQEDCSELLGLSLGLLCEGIRQLTSTETRPDYIGLRGEQISKIPSWLSRVEYRVGYRGNVAAFPPAVLELPVSLNPELRERCHSQWLQRRALPRSYSALVERAVTSLLSTGELSLDLVSRIIGVHPRVLQEKLAAEGSSFSQCLQKVRYRVACQHLGRKDMTTTELALMLGYGDLAAFSRAFKIWSGQSPRQWRKEYSG